MPQRDANHDIVKRALEKDGWKVTHDPLTLNYKGLRVLIDLGAEKQIASSKIAVEIKVFEHGSDLSDFEKAAGQYGIYRYTIEGLGIPRELFLAVALETYKKFFQVPAVQEYVALNAIHLLIFNHETEEVVEWIRQKK
ncbi:MAG: element excision factor XisH family protein [Blastocatellia bacterium]